MIMSVFSQEGKDDWISEKYIHIIHHINELKEKKQLVQINCLLIFYTHLLWKLADK